MIAEKENLKDTALWWLSPMQRSGFIIYRVLIFLFLFCLISLFFIHADQTVRARGIIRPASNAVRAAVSGNLQEFSLPYPGSSMQPLEQTSVINSDGELMGECFVSARDIGLLKIGQQARLELDAVNHNYFGFITAGIYSIDNDIIIQDQTPVFKVKCRLYDRILILPNGHARALQKGMGFQARFILAHRTLWQLLF